MSVIMADFKPSVSTLDEIKKLQDLVRKLEIQNMHLKNKQNMSSKKRSLSPSKEVKDGTRLPSKKETVKRFAENCDETIQDSQNDDLQDDLDIISISDMDMSDDESWLYTSPKGKISDKMCESPYVWLRKDVDDPENKQLQLTKKALLSKLNELEILSPPNQLPSSSRFVINPTINNLRRPQMSFKQNNSVHTEHAHIDTRTFTKSKKKQALEFLETLDMLENERNSDKCHIQELCRRSSDISLDSVSSCHVLEDANDVQVVARMQEESLRMSSPIGTPKRLSASSLSRKASLSSKSSVSDIDLIESPVVSSKPIDDGVFHSSIVSDPSSSYQNDSYNNSDQSSPSESPYSSNTSLNNSGKATKLTGYRRSLPNLNRDATFTRQSRPKVSCGTKLQVISSTKTLSRGHKSEMNFQAIQKTTKVTSPTRRRPTQASSSGSSHTESPRTFHPPVTRSAETQSRLRPRTGLPKPTRASSATRSKSGIPMPSSSKKHEDSWSDGCF